MCLEAAQKELDAQPNEEEGAAGGRDRGGGEKAARERGQKGYPEDLAKNPSKSWGTPRAEIRGGELRLEDENRGGEDDDLCRK